jgi:hypothetical protein
MERAAERQYRQRQLGDGSTIGKEVFLVKHRHDSGTARHGTARHDIYTSLDSWVLLILSINPILPK